MMNLTSATPQEIFLQAQLQQSKPTAIGGMDLGGSKLEAALFDGDLQEMTRQRWLIRGLDYPNLLDKLGEAATWLDQTAWQRGLGTNQAESDLMNQVKIPIGIGVPGVVDATTRLAVTSNLPASGKPFRQDLVAKLGRNFAMGNDSGLLALSEANGGAGTGFATVFGLIIGTGIGGGFCLNGRPHQGLNGAASLMTSEVGHMRLSCEKLLAKAASLTEIPCGCGRVGCIETLVSGPGLTRLGHYFSGETLTAAEIAAAAFSNQGGQSGLAEAFDVWLDLLGELAKAIQLAIDPDVIVLGGGLSQIAGLPELMTERLSRIGLKSLKLPDICLAKFGAASGVRGAAWLAYHQAQSAVPKPL
ncbi:MAG: ROK family protein [Alphaproteobacteria bacterium]|nr:ROK family protein [Alphaproteobacteria bacterium]